MQPAQDRPSPETIAAAEQAAGIEFSADERQQMLGAIAEQLQRFAARRAVAIDNSRIPSQTFDPWLGGDAPEGVFAHALPAPPGAPPELPERDEDLAFAPVADLAHWLATRAVTSRRLVELCLARIEQLDHKLLACITVDADGARAAADRLDTELAAGQRRGPLHGVPYGLKDLFDTKDLRTTFGAEPYRDRVPSSDATVVARLREAGAVMVAKTSLGALAYGDRWFGGRTNNPWRLEQGSSGSSAGSCAGVAAGLFPFALGTETYGSIVSPSMRCGTVGLRPTFGRVSRAGAMALCWSLDKVGVIARRVDDAALVLAAIAGRDAADPCSRAMGGSAADALDPKQLKVGARAEWFRAGSPEAHALEQVRELGCTIVEIDLPEGPWSSLQNMLAVEAAAAFEELTRTGADDQLAWQDEAAWPNTFRAAWFVPAIEYVQADRLRRILCERMAAAFAGVDAVLAPSFAADLLWTTNLTGQPSLTLRCAVERGQPRGVTLWGKLAGEGALVALGRALEERLGVWQLRPELE